MIVSFQPLLFNSKGIFVPFLRIGGIEMSKEKYVRKTFTYDGKRYTARGKTEAEAVKKMLQMQLDLEQGKVLLESKMTVRAWTERAIETYKTNQKEITRKKYVDRINHCILSEIGDMPLDKVKPLQCQEALNKQAGKSKTQVNEVYNGLKFIFSKAVENGLLNTSPAEYIIRPQYTNNKRRAITDIERKHLVEILHTDDRFLVFALMLYCGCRPSEAMNVQRNDFVNENGYWLLRIRGTKTAASDRYVPVPEEFENMIREKLDHPGFYPLCTTSSGKKIVRNDFERFWRRIRREMNISMGCKVYRNELIPPYPLADDFVPYNLRHTFCTDLQKQGVDIRTAQYMMGHSDIKTTANIYTHLDKLDAVKLAAQQREKNGTADFKEWHN